ncbi:MAG: hypothetical protein ACI8RC_002933, partial [Ilumatobacter sp.]
AMQHLRSRLDPAHRRWRQVDALLPDLPTLTSALFRSHRA